jgi:hypothetical protein
MPLCVNVPTGCKPKYFTGDERTPLGRGISPFYEKIGTDAKGTDGRTYMVGYVGLNTKKWIHKSWEK